MRVVRLQEREDRRVRVPARGLVGLVEDGEDNVEGVDAAGTEVVVERLRGAVEDAAGGPLGELAG
jgi:hypothetical protein